MNKRNQPESIIPKSDSQKENNNLVLTKNEREREEFCERWTGGDAWNRKSLIRYIIKADWFIGKMEYAHPRGEAHQNNFFYTKLAGKLEAEERRSKRLDFFFSLLLLFFKKTRFAFKDESLSIKTLSDPTLWLIDSTVTARAAGSMAAKRSRRQVRRRTESSEPRRRSLSLPWRIDATRRLWPPTTTC